MGSLGYWLGHLCTGWVWAGGQASQRPWQIQMSLFLRGQNYHRDPNVERTNCVVCSCSIKGGGSCCCVCVWRRVWACHSTNQNQQNGHYFKANTAICCFFGKKNPAPLVGKSCIIFRSQAGTYWQDLQVIVPWMFVAQEFNLTGLIGRAAFIWHWLRL